ncbi:MAG: amidohydrolase family protein, partial [Planctomycetota bacterium]
KKLEAKKSGDKKDSAKDAKPQAPTAKDAPRGMRPGSGRPVGRGRGPMPSRRPTVNPTEKPESSDKDKKSDDASKEKAADESKKEKEEKPPEKPDEDPTKEMLVKALHGKLPIRLTIRNADDFHFASKLLKEFDELAVIYEGVSQLGSATDRFVELGKPVVLGPWSNITPNYQSEPDAAQTFAAAFKDFSGTLVITTASRDSRGSKHLRTHAAAAVAAGMQPKRALKAITINAARVLGVADSLGSIEKGKRAHLVLIAGSPLDETIPVARVWSDGELVYKSDRDTLDGSATGDLAGEVATDSAGNWPKGSYVIRSSRVLDETGNYVPASLVIADGKISSIEASDFVCDLFTIDVGDHIITPGLLSSSTELGISSLIDPSRQADASYVVAADAIAGELPNEKELVSGGMLRAVLSPGSRNPLSGTASLVALGRNSPVETESLLMKVVLSGAARSADRFPSSLPGQVQLIEQSLSGNLLPNRLYLPASVVEALDTKRKEAWQAIQDGKKTLLIEAVEDSEIRAALDLIEEHGLKAVISGPTQLKPHVERLVATQTGVLLNPLTASSYDWYAADIAAASQAGIEIGFKGATPVSLRRTAGAAKKAGMSNSAAMLSLTKGPSSLGVDNRIAKGASADLIIWSGSPLSIASIPLRVIVDGNLVEASTKQPGAHLAEVTQ